MLIELSYTTMHKLVRQHPRVKQTLVKYYKERIQSTKQKRAKAGMAERRRHDRLREQVPVTFSLTSHADLPEELSNTTYQAASKDLAVSGLVLACTGSLPDVLDVGSHLRLEIELPSPWEKIRTVGTVRRLQAPTGDRKTAVLAIEFVAMSRDDTKKLEEFIHGEDHDQPES